MERMRTKGNDSETEWVHQTLPPAVFVLIVPTGSTNQLVSLVPCSPVCCLLPGFVHRGFSTTVTAPRSFFSRAPPIKGMCGVSKPPPRHSWRTHDKWRLKEGNIKNKNGVVYFSERVIGGDSLLLYKDTFHFGKRFFCRLEGFRQPLSWWIRT